MGAQQSAHQGAGAGAAGNAARVVRKACYYELLGVDRAAEDSEIRKAYKKKALELHPDRNFNDVENATANFAQVQTAYEILSDPQERAWYDSHRDAILRGDTDPDDAPPEYYNIRIITTEDIMTLIGKFNSNVPFNDSPNGFFGILDVTFGQLATEEAAACEWEGQLTPEYPSFGSAHDDHASVARPFYAAWSSFSTKKSFSWSDKWRLSDAPDRRMRRLMEKENKRLREDSIRDFNDAVRSLVAFVKKRDPRYVANTQSEADRQKILRDSAAAQAARARAANQAKMNDTFVPDWAQSRNDDDQYNDEFATSEEESEVEHFECVVCNKIFKSEKQFEVHEKSKKHVKSVQQLRRRMKKEGRDLDLDSDEPREIEKQSDEDLHSNIGVRKSPVADQAIQGQPPRGPIDESGTPATAIDDETDSSSGNTLDDEYAPREVVEKRLASDMKIETSGDESELAYKFTATALDDNDMAPKRMGKAKVKKAKRAAREAAQDASNKCGVCNQVFESRTKLFRHIKDEDHAQPQIVGQTGKKGKKLKR